MPEREIRVTTEDGQMTVFVVHPAADGPHPTALLLMDGVGYREQIRDNARRFAEAGYYVVAPDLYYRGGDGITLDLSALATLPADSPERARLMDLVASVTPERADGDTDALLEVVAADPAADASSLVCVGYCLGARLALHTAASRSNVTAAAGIHPGALFTDAPDSPHTELPRVTGELYVAFAEQDRSATPESVEAFRGALADAGVRGTVERLPGTAHGFAMADLPAYNRAAAEHHFERTVDLWRRARQN